MTDDSASVSPTFRAKVSTGYSRLDDALRGGFLAGSAVVLCGPTSNEVLELTANFLKPRQEEKCLFICRSLSTVKTLPQLNEENVTFLVCGERVTVSGNVRAGKGLENLTELSLDISEAVNGVQPKRVVIDIISDILLRHGGLQTRKWVSEQLGRLRGREITVLAIMNPSMHTQAETTAVADLFDGNVEILEQEQSGQHRKFLRVRWMHGLAPETEPIPLDLVQPSAVVKRQGVYPPNNLPAKTTQVIGREKELGEASTLLLRDEVQILTFTGPGGTGKTTLGLEVARSLLDSFQDGVFFVPLAPIIDPDLVIPTVTSTLGLKEEAGVSLLDRLKDFLCERQMLLVLDNFEQVLRAANQLADLRATCPKLKLLVTSRETLRISGEVEFPVTSLALPDLRHLPPLEQLSENPAVALFVQRGHAVKRDFELSTDNARAVAEICVRLDGLPLALELAAARIRILTPTTMLRKLETRLSFLTGGAQDLPTRQRTLRDTIAWSYDLLEDHEKSLFRRLAVFAGGFTLEAAEVVCNSRHDLDVLNGISLLAEKSLLRREEASGSSERIGMLETIREFALERLEASGEADEIRQAHAQYFLTLAKMMEPEYFGPKTKMLFDQLDMELDNFRAAFKEFERSGEGGSYLRLAAALWIFAYLRGHMTESRHWLSKGLAGSHERSSTRAYSLACGAVTAVTQGDVVEAESLFKEALAACKEAEDNRLNGRVLLYFGAFGEEDAAKAREFLDEGIRCAQETGDVPYVRGGKLFLSWNARTEGDFVKAKALAKEVLDLSRQAGDTFHMAHALDVLGECAMRNGKYAEARSLYDEELALFRGLGFDTNIGDALLSLGQLARIQRDEAATRRYLQEAQDISHKTGEVGQTRFALHELALLEYQRRDYPKAEILFKECLAICLKKGRRGDVWIARCLLGLALVANAQGLTERAAALLGAAEVEKERIKARVPAPDSAEYERNLVATKSKLGEQMFESVFQKGREMGLTQAAETALSDPQG